VKCCQSGVGVRVAWEPCPWQPGRGSRDPLQPHAPVQRGGVGWHTRRLFDLPVVLCRQTKAIIWSCDATGSRLSDFFLFAHGCTRQERKQCHGHTKVKIENCFVTASIFSLSLYFFPSSISIEVQVIVTSKSTYILIVKVTRVHKKLSKSANC
jgi:hypothetical protein